MGSSTSLATTEGPIFFRVDMKMYTHSVSTHNEQLEQVASDYMSENKLSSFKCHALPYSKTHAIHIGPVPKVHDTDEPKIQIVDLHTLNAKRIITLDNIKQYYRIEKDYLLVDTGQTMTVICLLNAKRHDLPVDGYRGACVVHVNRILIYTSDMINVYDTRTLGCVDSIPIEEDYQFGVDIGRVDDTKVFVRSEHFCYILNLNTHEKNLIYNDANATIRQCGMIGNYLVLVYINEKGFLLYDTELFLKRKFKLSDTYASFCEDSFGKDFLFQSSAYKIYITDLKTLKTKEFTSDWMYMSQVIQISPNAYFLNGRSDSAGYAVKSYIYYAKEETLEKRGHSDEVFGVAVFDKPCKSTLQVESFRKNLRKYWCDLDIKV